MARKKQILSLEITIQLPIARRIKPAHMKEFLQNYGQHAIAAVNDRVLRAKDLEGKKFREYDPDYKKWKARVRGKKTTGNWLQLTGAMMNSFKQVSLTDKRVVLGFVGASTREIPSLMVRKRKKKRRKKQGNTQLVDGADSPNVSSTQQATQKPKTFRGSGTRAALGKEKIIPNWLKAHGNHYMHGRTFIGLTLGEQRRIVRDLKVIGNQRGWFKIPWKLGPKIKVK
jgi:hypothetical protein